ncbi:ABC transporter substrate-binding protein [Candidatus Methylacidiphilum infernorum]|uniref:ABC transporter substrate-binding protein n=1 Tax=Candidatus Methylacidiphilum infernorum TaxID=511746 RepID=A0ABX7PVU4_9BACT|nr:CmpA/NrtA family ABC transporter substrate-binding protein [Candidatus Methylacidiphilum infernorum]QSR86798.1 ABC transporter substrate-binding protein [Candidatus Methylacidiphilum infernorum]
MRTRTKLSIGYLPLIDCAPFVVAYEREIFQKWGFDVYLSQEPGWATIRDKIVYGEVDFAQAVCGLPLVLNFGLRSIPSKCACAMILNLNGNAITLSKKLGASKDDEPEEILKKLKAKKSFPLLFGVASFFSSHYFLLLRWLKSIGLNPHKEVRIVALPPPQMPLHLKQGLIDGYCVGEPWNSLALFEETGSCVATSLDLAPGHPEKVLLAGAKHSEKKKEEHIRLVCCLIEACQWADNPEHRAELSEMLHYGNWIRQPLDVIRHSLVGPFRLGKNTFIPGRAFHVFNPEKANKSSQEKEQWIIHEMEEAHLLPKVSPRQSSFLDKTVYLQAEKLLSLKNEKRLATVCLIL